MNNKLETGTAKKWRKILMGGGALVTVIVCAGMYLVSGRYIATDNAYVKSAKILVTPEVSGVIRTVGITDNQHVKKGDVLFTIDPSAYEIALQRAEADVAVARARVEELKANYRQKQKDIERAVAIAVYNQKSYSRVSGLVKSGAVSKETVDATTSSNLAAQKDVDMLREDLGAIVAELGGDPDIAVEDNPSYKAALAALNTARLNLARTQIIAPVDGLAGAAPHSGDYARESLPVMNMVGTDEVWIEANYKETELTNVVPGQKVAIEVDTYPGLDWQGQVESISPATGSEFSVLPAQNATGNWVKIVQRIAVKIKVAPQQNGPDLRAGMSTHVKIDTGKYPHIPGRA